MTKSPVYPDKAPERLIDVLANRPAPFCPPKPNHRSHNMSNFKKFFFFKGDLLESYTENAYSYLMGKNNMGLSEVYAINCLDTAHKVLINKAKTFPKSTVMSRAFEPLIGNSVFSVNGSVWKAQRKRLSPAFSHIQVKQAFLSMRDAVDRMLKNLEKASKSGEIINFDVLMSQVTSDVIFRVMFGGKLDGKRGKAIYDSFQIYQREQKYFSLRTIINWPKWLPILGKRHNKKALQAAKNIRDILFDIVNARLEIPADKRPSDMLTSILDKYKEDFGDRIPAIEVVDQIAFFFLAGHETTAAATTWASYLLTASPYDKDKMLKEVKDVVGDRPLEFSDIRKLKNVTAVFKEAMRLYAPVPYFPRQATEKTELRSHTLKQGSQCTVNAYFIHRHTKWWDHPDAFIPERFMKDDRRPDHPMAYIPFSAGPRVCPGASFATVESVLLLSSMFRQYDFKLVEGMDIATFSEMTLRPKNGIHVTITKK